MPVLDASSTSSANVAGAPVDSSGIYIPAGWGKQWKAKRNASATTAVEIAWFGDSTSWGAATPGYYTPTQRVRDRAVSAGYLDGGHGVFGPDDDTSTSLLTQGDGTTLPTASSNWTIAGGNNAGIRQSSWQTDTVGQVLTLQGRGTKVRLDMCTRYGGRFDYSIDGGAAVRYNPTLFPADSLTVSGLADGLHTVAITNVGGLPVATPTPLNISTQNDAASTLTKGGQYFYKVTGVTAAGETTASSYLYTTTNASVAQDIVVGINSTTTDNYVSFNVYRATVASGFYGLIGNIARNTSAANTYFTDNGLAASGTVTAPASSTAGYDTTNKTLLVNVEFLRGTGVVVQKFATSGIATGAYFATSVPSLLNYQAAIALGLDPTQPTSDNTGWTLPKATGSKARNVGAAVFALGTNDTTTADPTGTLTDGIDIFARMCRAAGVDPIVWLPAYEASVGAHAWAGRAIAASQAAARAHGCAIVDQNQVLGPMNGWAAKGYGPGTIGAPHLNTAAYQAEADALWDGILGLASYPS